MPKAKKRFYEIRPGWPGGDVPMEMDGWSGTAVTSMSFEYMENFYGKKFNRAGGY